VTIQTNAGDDLTVAVEDAAASIDSVDTVVDQACGASSSDRRVVYLASTTSVVVGSEYLMVNAGGQREWVHVEEVNAGVSVAVESDLEHDYAAGATFQGTRLTYQLSSANTTEDDKALDFRVAWTYVVDLVTCTRETYYDLVRNPWYRAATSRGFEAANREIYARAKDDGAPLGELLDEAWETVLRRIDARGWRPGLIVGMERLAPPTYEAGILILAEMGYRPAGYTDLETWIDLRERRLRDSLDRALAGVKWYDQSDDAEKSAAETRPALGSTRMRF